MSGHYPVNKTSKHYTNTICWLVFFHMFASTDSCSSAKLCMGCNYHGRNSSITRKCTTDRLPQAWSAHAATVFMMIMTDMVVVRIQTVQHLMMVLVSYFMQHIQADATKEFGGMGSIFDSCVYAIWRSFWQSRMEVSYCTSRFGTIIRCDLHTLSLAHVYHAIT